MEDAIRGWVSLICRAQRDATTRVCARNPCVIVQTKAPDPPPYTSLNIYSNAKTFSAFHRALPARQPPRARGEPSIQSFNFFPAFLIHPLVEWRFILTNFSVSIRCAMLILTDKRKCVTLFFFRIFYYHNINRLIQFKFGRV